LNLHQTVIGRNQVEKGSGNAFVAAQPAQVEYFSVSGIPTHQGAGLRVLFFFDKIAVLNY
jgi:hypothetical protein